MAYCNQYKTAMLLGMGEVTPQVRIRLIHMVREGLLEQQEGIPAEHQISISEESIHKYLHGDPDETHRIVKRIEEKVDAVLDILMHGNGKLTYDILCKLREHRPNPPHRAGQKGGRRTKHRVVRRGYAPLAASCETSVLRVVPPSHFVYTTRPEILSSVLN